jgi:3-methyladenine DNA glycosylase/8-oxoguanine DNA glycosylase
MKFKNCGESRKIRLGTIYDKYYWVTLKYGQIIDLPEELGIKLCLEKYIEEEIKTTPAEINNKPIETKQIEVLKKKDNSEKLDEFFKELVKIKGIGTSTAKDIVVWGNKEKLIDSVKNKEQLPFRDDIVKILEGKYG